MLSADSVPSPAGLQGPAPARLRRLRVALGTWVAIEATADSEAIAAGAIEAAFAAVSEVERCMHPEREGSDIARIHSAPPRVQTPIHASTWEVLSLAQRLSGLTAGVFDPCLPQRPGRVADLELSGAPAGSAPWAVRRAPLMLDLGGIAKGYAIDCAIAALRAAACHAGAVNAGGDLRLFGGRRETLLLRHRDRYQALVLQDARQALRQKIDERPHGGQQAAAARKHHVDNPLGTVPGGQYSREHTASEVLAHHTLGQPRDSEASQHGGAQHHEVMAEHAGRELHPRDLAVRSDELPGTPVELPGVVERIVPCELRRIGGLTGASEIRRACHQKFVHAAETAHHQAILARGHRAH